MGLLDWANKKAKQAAAHQAGRGDALAFRQKRTDLPDDEGPHYLRGWTEGVAERQATARGKAREKRQTEKWMNDV